METDGELTPRTGGCQQLRGTKQCDFLTSLPGLVSWKGPRDQVHLMLKVVVVQGADVKV